MTDKDGPYRDGLEAASTVESTNNVAMAHGGLSVVTDVDEQKRERHEVYCEMILQVDTSTTTCGT